MEELKKTEDTKKIIGTELLSDALNDSELLIAHASEHGIFIDKKLISTIVSAKNLEQQNSWTEKGEVEFWDAYRIISEMIKPVTVDSLRAANDIIIKRKTWFSKLFKIKKKKSLVRRSVFFYALFALISMIILLYLQIYAVKGSKLLSNINSGNKKIHKIEDRLRELVIITSQNHDDRSAMMEQDKLETENDLTIKELESRIKLLTDWLSITYYFTPDSLRMFSVKKILNKEDTPGPPSFESESDFNNKIIVIQDSQNYLLILNRYILPLIYGLMGGFVFILRSLAAETKHMTFSKETNITYTLRIHLGALIGLLVGLFWGDIESQELAFVESLSPLAVAFLAGYSVEYLFKGIDTFIGSTFTKAVNVNKNNTNNTKNVVKDDDKN